MSYIYTTQQHSCVQLTLHFVAGIPVKHFPPQQFGGNKPSPTHYAAVVSELVVKVQRLLQQGFVQNSLQQHGQHKDAHAQDFDAQDAKEPQFSDLVRVLSSIIRMCMSAAVLSCNCIGLHWHSHLLQCCSPGRCGTTFIGFGLDDQYSKHAPYANIF